MYVDGIPYVTMNEAISRIQGEVYSVDDNTLRKLDSLEQHPEWYYREKVDIALDGQGTFVSAWLYLMMHLSESWWIQDCIFCSHIFNQYKQYLRKYQILNMNPIGFIYLSQRKP